MKKISRVNVVSKFHFRYGACIGVLLGLFAAQAAFSATVADSVADFSGIQGSNSWYYGRAAPVAAQVPVLGPFIELTYYTGGVWHPGSTTNAPLLSRASAHPGYETGLSGQWAVRKYISTVSGPVRLSGKCQHMQTGGGDGTTARLYVNGRSVYAKMMPANAASAGPLFNRFTQLTG